MNKRKSPRAAACASRLEAMGNNPWWMAYNGWLLGYAAAKRDILRARKKRKKGGR
jgi:hypothetical protein